MNQKLQQLLDSIQQSAHLSDDEKNALEKNVKDADKELEITTFKLDRTEKVKRTTAILLEETIAELEQKRKSVEEKNRELEIETALEKVRTVAMSMNNPDDMLHVCRIISEQLELLKVKDIRNVQTAIFYEAKGTYINYEFYTKHDKTIITEVDYKNHAVSKAFANQMIKGPNEVYTHSFEGDKVKEWYEFQKTTNVFIDTYLENANSLDYYWFSLGPVALGISTYSPLNEEENKLFRRFLKVFELAYRRYLDIEKALGQAKEARIETSLERVRAVAMAMKKSGEVINVCEVMYNELLDLGFDNIRNAQIAIKNDAVQSYLISVYSISETLVLQNTPYKSSPIVEELYNELGKSKDAFFQKEFSGEKFDSWRKWRETFSPLRDSREANATSLCFYLYSIGDGHLGISTYNTITNEQVEILKRFKNVFELSYQRYTDVAKAEAQAREAQIELALERVRARTMAMQKSDELAETSFVLFQQFKDLGETSEQISIGIFNEDEHVMELYSTLNGSQWKDAVKVDLDEPVVMKKIHEAWKEQKKSLVIDLSGKHLREYNAYRKKLSNLEYREDRWVINIACFSKGVLTFSTADPHPAETIQLLERFAGVFDQTYTRFLDLKKAEAQARESKIEAALERLRAKAMAMHHSDELDEVLAVLCEQFDILGILPMSAHLTVLDIEHNKFTFRETGKFGNRSFGEQTVALDAMDTWKDMVESWKNAEPYSINSLHFPKETLPHVWEVFHESFASMPEGSRIVPDDYPDGIYHTAGKHPFGYIGMNQVRKATEEEEQIVVKFANEFGRAYQRFLDLQKAEAQAREAQIELGLERVRARAMAMQKSDELSELVDTVFKELTKLDFALTWCIINIIDEPSLSNTVWAANPDINKMPESYHMLFEDYPFHHAMMKGWKERKIKSVYTLEGDEKLIYDEYLFNETEFKKTPEAAQAASRAMEKYVVSFSFSNFGGLQTVGGVPLSDANLDILSRFGKVFDLTYTRFNDLKQAEAQAKESQIQLALERIRARTMAMQRSDELMETAVVLFNQLNQLGENIERTIIGVMNEEERVVNIWATRPDGSQMDKMQKFPIDEPIVWQKIYTAWRHQKKSIVIDLRGEELEGYFQFLKARSSRMKRESLGERRVESFVFFSKGILGVISADPETPPNVGLYERFASVFEQTYTRFLDLQKAEAQAREAQIQLALERARTQSMLMQHSKELDDTLRVFHEQVLLLGINSAFSFLWLPDEDKERHIFWAAWAENLIEGQLPKNNSTIFKSKAIDYPLDRNEPATAQCLVDWKGSEPVVSYHVPPDGVANYFAAWSELITGVEQLKPEYFSGGLYYVEAFMKYGCFGVIIKSDLSEEEKKILLRFTIEFERTYTRFLDLQKAEAQARESQIQLALERVRARTMAMQKSDELKYAATLLFQQAKALGVPAYSCGYNIWEKGEKEFTSWMSTQDGSDINGVPNIPLTEDANFIRYVESKQKGEPFFVLELRGERMQEHYQYLKTIPAFKGYFDYAVSVGFDLPETQIHYIANFSQGNLLFITLEPCPEFHDVFKRFAAVFEQTYTRFLDLQKAEAQVREAKIEAALEKVRSKTMAMHNSQDVGDTVATLFDEFVKLGIETFRCGIGIIHQEKKMEVWTAKRDANGKVNFFTGFMDMTMHPLLQGGYSAWKKKQESYIYELKGDDLKEYFSRSNNNPNYPLKYDIPSLPSRLIFSVFYFPEGFLFAFTLEELPAETTKIFKRFSGVFGQTYRRYLDLQKAEAQAKEAQIEAALERVRSRSMGMQKSEELKEVIQIVYEQFVHLNINVEHTGFVIDYKARDDYNIWIADPLGVPSQVTVPYFDSVYYNRFNEAKKNGDDFFATNLSFEEKNKFYQKLFEYVPGLPEEAKEFYFSCPGLAASTVLLENVGLYIENFSGTPYSDEDNKTLMRFGKVFQQTYTRFLDLQKAEAQARESQIQLALERVRARTMAMQKSDELSDAVYVLFQQFKELGEKPDQATIGVINEDEKVIEYWVTMYGNPINKVFKFSFDEPNVTGKIYKAWQENKKSLIIDLSGDALTEFMTYRAGKGGAAINPDEKRRVINIAFFSKGLLNVQFNEERSEESIRLLERFAFVFEQTYTRFLDLQKAEAQTREAQIEAALEKVRSRAMAMQKPNELIEVAQLLRKEMGQLGIEELETSSIYIHDETTGKTECWYAIKDVQRQEKALVSDHMNIDLKETSVGREMLTFYQSGKKQTSILMQGDARKEWINYCADHSKVLEGFYGDNIPDRTYHLYKFSGGYMGAASLGDISAESWDLLKRATNVFSLAYTRFSDLQQAEMQAREATIEAALERVRSRTMAMRQSNELAETSSVLFQQIKKLGFETWSCGFCIWKNDERLEAWMGADSGDLLPPLIIPYKEEETHHEIYKAHLQKEQSYNHIWEGKSLKKHYQFLKTLPSVKEAIDMLEASGLTLPSRQCYYVGFFKQGYLLLITKEVNEELKDLSRRFAQVFDLTYTRFLDLQKAEANTREAIKQAALDRIRADIASMRTTKDLERITPLIWNELNILGVPFIRCGVFIMNDEQRLIHTFLSTPDGKAIAAFHIPYDTPGNIKHVISHWRDNKNYIAHWDEDAFTEFAKMLVTQGALTSSKQYLKTIPQGGFYLHFLPFLQGMLYVGNTTQLRDDEINLIQSIADAFSTAYARYEDFNKLEAAKEQVDITLNELQATQKQLIQSEKMASLGELTAGIAHEIQNPLNFVNNFSEVSNELIEELKSEKSKGKGERDEQLEDDLLNDIKQNLEKINHHGKRADAIVKGMLQHSRSSTNVKEPTDINKLADEYLRLAYHGLRAKDNSFNATMKTGYDETIGKINIVPQDIGRVILNLITNAFYAVTEKAKDPQPLKGSKEYLPTVTVSTKSVKSPSGGLGVELTVKDNGNGMPKNIVDKIFQPFFTTKPTGQGTGLGLSLAYDIIKAHGGSILVNSTEGNGSEFIVQLPLA